MLIKLFVFIGLIAFTAPPAPSADNSTIDLKGKVIEESTGEPLTGVSVTIVELNKQIYTDFDGNFDLEDVKPGTYHLNISFASFQSADLDNLLVNKNSDPLLISLK